MLNSMNVKKIVISLISSLLSIAGVVGIIMAAVLYNKNGNPIRYVNIGFLVVSFIFACIYLYLGFSKKGSLFYKLFMISLAVSGCICALETTGQNTKISVCFIIPLLGYIACYTILGFGYDLGRKNTIAIGIILLVCSLTPIIYTAVNFKALNSAEDGVSQYLLIEQSCRFVLALLTGSFILGKYADKQERGRKL